VVSARSCIHRGSFNAGWTAAVDRLHLLLDGIVWDGTSHQMTSVEALKRSIEILRQGPAAKGEIK
jgi:hypothetical protein